MRETVRKAVEIEFPNMIVGLIDRMGIVHFTGFLNGKIPSFLVDERELKEKWSLHPLDLLLSIHINGKKMYHTHIALFRETEGERSGTLGVVEIERIKKECREGRL